MRIECPDYLSKVAPIIGDCTKPNLGIYEIDRNKLIGEVEIIFHAAATVRFDANMREAVNINIRATDDLLEIARSMKQLKVRKIDLLTLEILKILKWQLFTWVVRNVDFRHSSTYRPRIRTVPRGK